MKAVLCPVCLGTGKFKEMSCHGCDGKGWILVPEDHPYFPEPYDTYHRRPFWWG